MKYVISMQCVSFHLCPNVTLKIKAPHIAVMMELVQGCIFATKDVHFVSKNNRLMGTSGWGCVEGLDFLPFVLQCQRRDVRIKCMVVMSIK